MPAGFATRGPVLTAIFTSPAAGAPMRSVPEIEAIVQRGLRGDRYAAAAGTWQGGDACQVTLITEDDLHRAKAGDPGLSGPLECGGHRRNLVIAGVKTERLEGKEFRIGTAMFRYDKPRPPCGHLDRVSGQPLARALGRHSGVCVRVVRGGRLAVGDALEILDSK